MMSRLVEEELRRGQVENARLLLNSDDVIRSTVLEGVQRGKEALGSLGTAINFVSSIYSCLKLKSNQTWSSLYIKAMAGELRDSAVIEDLLLAIKRLPSDAMKILFDLLGESSLPGISAIATDLRHLEAEKDSVDPLRSKYDTHHESLRTTVVAYKVELSRHKSSLSEDDLAYSELVDRVDNILKDYLDECLIDPQTLFLHEILVYDLKSPHREVFAPKPRYAIERALSSPRDYLGCECCKGAQHGLSGTHPATSVLYQLYLESGAIVNIADLWSAFFTIVGNEDAEDEEAEQERALYVHPCQR